MELNHSKVLVPYLGTDLADKLQELIKHAKLPMDKPKDAKDPYSIFFWTIADKLDNMPEDEKVKKVCFCR